MSFLLPIGLLALLALPLIVLLHIIRERRKRVVVPSLLNWQNLPRPKQGQRLNRLPLTLLLLLHVLVAALLALAIARPQLVGNPLQRATQLVVVLDISTSMATGEANTSRFEQAREAARTLIRGLGAGDKLTLIAANATPRVVAVGATETATGLEAALDQLQAGGAVANLDQALTLAEAALDSRQPGRIVVLTDGGASPPANRATVAPVEWRQIGGDQENRAITAFSSRISGGNMQVYTRVANYSDQAFSGVMRLSVDANVVDARPVEIAPNAEAEQTWTLPANGSSLQLALNGADALPGDDTALVNLATTRSIRVLLVTDTPDPIERAVQALAGTEVRVVAPASYTPSDDADITIFERFLPQTWPNSAVLVIHPPDGNTLLPVRGVFDPRGEALVQRGALLNGLGFGGVNFGGVQALEPTDGMATLLAAGETALIQQGRVGATDIMVWSFDLRESNLSTRLAFPLLVARTLRDLAPTPLPASLQAGTPLVIRPDQRATAVDVVAPDGLLQQVPISGTTTLDMLTQPGWYDIIERSANGERFRGRVAVNSGTPIESDLRQHAAPTFTAAVLSPANTVVRQVTDLWPLLAVLALLALIAEWGYVHLRPAR